jgi:anti-sigma factor RsiW
MEHAEAIDRGAVERYALGEMSERERDQYEEHFFDCPECAAEVKAAVLFLDNAEAVVRESDPPGEPENLKREADAPSYRVVPVPPSPGQRWKALFWPIPLGAAAALVALLGGPAAYLAFLKVPELQRARGEAESLQAASWHFLSVSRSEPPVVRVAGSERMVGLTLSQSEARALPYYLCEVRDAGGRVVLSNVVAAPPGGGELQLLLPTGKLQPGAHVVAVAGLEAASSRTPATDFTLYPFTFERP